MKSFSNDKIHFEYPDNFVIASCPKTNGDCVAALTNNIVDVMIDMGPPTRSSFSEGKNNLEKYIEARGYRIINSYIDTIHERDRYNFKAGISHGLGEILSYISFDPEIGVRVTCNMLLKNENEFEFSDLYVILNSIVCK